MMREAGRTPQNEVVDIVEGEVTSVSPLKVKVDNRELTEAFLILGALCQETIITRTADSGTYIFENPHGHTGVHGATSEDNCGIYQIKLWRGLKVGDKVMMIKLGRGQKYYVLQRKEGVKP
jgi:hypothetical protein